jgi:hypothetical protein
MTNQATGNPFIQQSSPPHNKASSRKEKNMRLCKKEESDAEHVLFLSVRTGKNFGNDSGYPDRISAVFSRWLPEAVNRVPFGHNS